MYVIHFLIVAAIFAGALSVSAADRAGAVVLFYDPGLELSRLKQQLLLMVDCSSVQFWLVPVWYFHRMVIWSKSVALCIRHWLMDQVQ